MRRSALFVIGCALSLYVIGAAPAAADNGPHVKGAGLTPDTCAACHRAHTAKAPYLLKEDADQLCFTCHGSSGAGSNEDVQDGVGYEGAERASYAGALRGGGFKYALINTAKPEPKYEEVSPYRLIEATIPPLGEGEGQETTSTHSYNETEQTAWGNGAINAEVNYGKGVKLGCTSCHDQHGNGNYRILRPIPSESGSATEVAIPDAEKHVYTTTNYWQSWDTNDPAFRWKVSEWCTQCHTRYLAGSGSYKTPSGDAVYNYRHRTSYTQAEYEATELATPKKAKPNCIQCHVSHGSNASMGSNSQSVTWPDGSAAGSDGRLLRLNNRGVCQTCHHK
jgi:predicted CXXCH cytochrome family protein